MKIINLVEDTKGNPTCGYEHGLSFYIETKKHKLLVDCGATDLFMKNADTLGIDLTQVDTVILSHGHYDHSGGILPFTKINETAKIYLKDTAGGEYYHVTSSMEKYIGIDKNILKLLQCEFVTGEKELDDEVFLFSDITGTKYPIKGNLKLKKKLKDTFVQDSFAHEQCVVVSQEGKKILISGCAHNGIINILDRYYEIFASYPDVVISGFHMMQKEEYIEEDVVNIQNIGRELVQTQALYFSGHCTGQSAFDILKEIMGEQLQAIHSGESIRF